MHASRFLAALFVPALLAGCASSRVLPRADLVGSSAPATAAARSVTLTPETRSVNVVGGEVVRFEAAGGSFAWDFSVSPIVQVFALNQVAPGGLLDHEVLVHVQPDPRYHGP